MSEKTAIKAAKKLLKEVKEPMKLKKLAKAVVERIHNSDSIELVQAWISDSSKFVVDGKKKVSLRSKRVNDAQTETSNKKMKKEEQGVADMRPSPFHTTTKSFQFTYARVSVDDTLLKPEFWSSLDDDDTTEMNVWKEMKRSVLNSTPRQGALIISALCDGFMSSFVCEEETTSEFFTHVKKNSHLITTAIYRSRKGVSIEEILLRYENTWMEKETDCNHFIVQENSRKAFYVCNKNLDFRHEGVTSHRPPRVALQEKSKDDRVQVLFSASGTGKSVELAGSAYTRDADLALVWSRTATTSDVEMPSGSSKEHRQIQAQETMVNVCEDLRSETLQRMLNEIKEVTSSQYRKLRLVLCLDEMESLPIFVRSVIADRHVFAKIVIETLLSSSEIKNVEVVFSIAGTGVSRGSIGSTPENFRIEKTHATEAPHRVFETLDTKIASRMTWENMKAEVPVLFSLMEHNGRMLSIAVNELGRMNENDYMHLSSRIENVIVHRVLLKFVDSNGVSRVAEKDRPLLGACALAVHLFQKSINVPPEQVEVYATNLDYGIAFARYQYSGLKDGTVTLGKLVGEAGLLVPIAFPENGKLDRPFSLDSAMQLLCIYLLSSQVNAESFDLLECTPFGFEVLSTNLIKCAIASSMVVCSKERMSVGDLLKEKLGFFFEPTWKLEPCASTLTIWNELSGVKATRLPCIDHNHPPKETYHHEVMAESVKLENVNRDHLEVVGGETPKEGLQYGLQFDKEAMRRLLLISENERNRDKFFVPPIASVAFGSSPLADGYVTFVGELNKAEHKYTIMVQSKDYFGKTSLSPRRVRKNGERCYAESLAVGFGSRRLFSVAARKRKLSLSKEGVERNFVGFAVDHSKLLTGLMGALDDRRDPTKRFHKHGKIYVLGQANVQ